MDQQDQQDQFFQASVKLHAYIVANHWDEQALLGPDPGIRFNYRIGRFIKSYLRYITWSDNYYYLQAQGYWILGNWTLLNLTDKPIYRDIALRCSEYMLSQQRADGAWDYPNPEWKGRVATNEGTWGALSLLETYRQTMDPLFLTGALRWHEFLVEKIGFQRVGDELAINYFANTQNSTIRVPNNSITVLRFLADLAETTGETKYMEPVSGLLTFIQGAQKLSGEFPYAVGRGDPNQDRPHFQCYQYNAFECLNLIKYHEITTDKTVLPLITQQLEFLSQGLAEAGYAFYDCNRQRRTVTYHTAALGAAFSQAGQLGITGYASLARRAYGYVLALQDRDGGFLHSQYDYGILTDRRSYPRYLAMILYHLLHQKSPQNPGSKDQSNSATQKISTTSNESRSR